MDKKIVLIGAGIKCTEAILNYGKEQIVYIYDNFKKEDFIEGIPTISLEKLKQNHEEFKVVFTPEKEAVLYELSIQFTNLNIPYEIYSRNSTFFFQRLHIFGSYPELKYDYYVNSEGDRVVFRHYSDVFKKMFSTYGNQFKGKNLDFWICNVDDSMRAYRFAVIHRIPYVFSWSTKYGIEDRVIPIPDYRSCFDEAIYPWEETQKRCREASFTPVQDERAFWIGSPREHPVREALFHLGERYPEYLDIRKYCLVNDRVNLEKDGFVPMLK